MLGDLAAVELQVQLVRNLKELVELVDRVGTKKLWIVSAYVNEGGVDALLPLLERAKQVTAVLGAGKNTDPTALQKLKDRGVTLRFRRLDQGEFHPKCYVGFGEGEAAWAAIGSANLTQAALQANVELMTFIRGAARHPFFSNLQGWLDQQYRHGVMPTPRLLKAIHALYETNRRARADTEVAKAEESLQQMIQESMERRRSHPIFRYINSTRLQSSYKLVILGALLQAKTGTMSVDECAGRFLAFYKGLVERGLPPERMLKGARQLIMSRPERVDLHRVVQMLSGRKGVIIKPKGITQYKDPSSGKTILSARQTLTAAQRKDAFEELVERLCQYYWECVGIRVEPSVIRQLFKDPKMIQ